MRWHWKFWPALKKLSPALNVFSPALIVPIPVNRFPNELAPKESNNIPRNYLFCSPASVLLANVKKTPRSFINNENSLRDSAISMILFTSSLFKTIDVTVQDPNSFLQIDATLLMLLTLILMVSKLFYLMV